MIVAAGGGERDYAVDAAILSALPSAADPGTFLNEHLLSDLRPTLFLAQLSNLLAGNISIVHGVVGSSRTFMGEEAAGTDAVRICLRAHRRGAGRPVPGRRLLQRAAAGRAAALRNGRIALEATIRRCLGAPGRRRRHGAGNGRLLPGDREPRARSGARRDRAGAHRRDRYRPQPTAARGGNHQRHPPAHGDAPSPRAAPCCRHLRSVGCVRTDGRGGKLSARPGNAGARYRRRHLGTRWNRRSSPIWLLRRCRFRGDGCSRRSIRASRR